MRASWFRGRAPHELEDGNRDRPQPSPDADVPDSAEDPAEPPSSPAPRAVAPVPSVRPAFGHPTF